MFYYRNGLELQNSLWTYGFLLYIQLCCCLLFIVHEYWRNSTSYATRFITHLYCDLQPYRQYGNKTFTKLQLLLSISCLASFTYIDFILSTHIDLQSMLRFVAYSVYLLLRNGWHSISWRESAFIQSCLYSFSQPRDIHYNLTFSLM